MRAKAPPLGELSPEVTERARTLTEKYGRCDSITLTKALLIAVRRLYRTGLALSVIASQCHLSQRERHWRAGQAHAGQAKFDFIVNSSALL